VTIPYLPELYQPTSQLLDLLFPHTVPSELDAARATGKAKAIEQAKKEGKQVYVPTLETPVVNPFMRSLTDFANQTQTTNGAGAFRSTQSAVLDSFASLNQSTKPEDFDRMLTRSWKSSPELTLRVIWNLRSVHEGKSARLPFYRAYAWLYANHPRTAIENLKELVGPVVKRVVKRKIPPPIGEEEERSA